MRITPLRRAAALSAGVLVAGLVAAAGPAQAATKVSSPAFGDIDTPAANLWTSGSVNVSGLSGKVSDVNVTLRKPAGVLGNLDIYLQSPSGQKVWLLSDVCAGGIVKDFDIVIDDAAPAKLPANASDGCGATTVKPANYNDGGDDGGVIAAETLAAFNGSEANGSWTLLVRNEQGATSGAWTESLDGFDLTIETVAATAPETKVAKVKTKHRKVVINLASDKPGATFQAKVKAKAGSHDWQPTKKATKAVGKNLANGKTIIWVRAVDNAGNVDATPVKVKVKVLPNGTVKAKVKG